MKEIKKRRDRRTEECGRKSKTERLSEWVKKEGRKLKWERKKDRCGKRERQIK